MRLSRAKLVGWLCILRLNIDRPFYIPPAVQAQLVELGWCEVCEPLDDDGRRDIHVTEAGALASDLAAPEWGVDPVPVE